MKRAFLLISVVLFASAVSYGQIATVEPVGLSAKAAFKGTYTIGASENADYATFAEAVAAMQDGVAGAVRFQVEAGTYRENIRITSIQGTSADHGIVFTSLSGNNDDVVITGSGYSEPPYGGQKYGMVAVDSTQYVTFENLSFVPSVQTYPYAVHILHTSRYFTMKNCIVSAETNSDYSGMSLFKMESRNEEGQNNDYVTLEGNRFHGGYIALYLGGTSYVKLTKERGAVVRDNVIVDAGSKGIYLVDEQDVLVENNTVVSSATKKTSYIGLDMFRNKGKIIVRNNKIVNNQAYYSIGINLRTELSGTAEEPALVYNNSIALTASPNASSYGINIESNCSNIALYHNTVNMAGVAGYAFGVTRTYETIENVLLQNNLIQNHTASPVYFFSREAQLKACTFRNNAYHLTGEKFSNNWGDDFPTWEATSGETASFEEQAQFVSLSDLHLKESGNLNAGVPISFLTTDADGKERSKTAPTIGAYEFGEIEVVTPEIAAGYPKTGEITYHSIRINTQWSESGVLYYLIKKSEEEASSEADLLKATSVAIEAGVESGITFDNLQEQADYKAYFLLVSHLDARSEVVATGTIRTAKRIYPLEVELPGQWERVEAGTSVTLHPVVSGGVYPYAYEWKSAVGEVLSVDSLLTVAPEKVSQYSLTVTDNNESSTTLYTDVFVTGDAVVATFDDLSLAPESYWSGRETETMESTFYSGSYSFSNTYAPEYATWGGFAYSNVTDTSFDPNRFLDHQFRSVTGSGVDNSPHYGVVYTMGVRTDVKIMHNPEGDVVPGVYITNNAYAYHSMTQGDSFTGDPFTVGDFFKVVFKGTPAVAGSPATTVEYYLADYRSANESEHRILTDWQWVDLSPLGKITKLRVTLEGSRTGSWGLNTPAYLCIDNFGGTDPSAGGSNLPAAPSLAWKVYPVPAVDVLHIQTPCEDYSIRVFNLLGTLLIEQKGQGNAEVRVSHLPKGTYLLEVVSDEGRWTKRFIH